MGFAWLRVRGEREREGFVDVEGEFSEVITILFVLKGVNVCVEMMGKGKVWRHGLNDVDHLLKRALTLKGDHVL